MATAVDDQHYVQLHAAGGPGIPRLKGATRSSFGLQSDSRRITSPLHSFGASCTREQASRVFITAQHTAVDHKGRTAPLGTYNLPPAIARQPEALKLNAPSYSFSQLDREQAKGVRPFAPPPVGTYDAAGSAFGEQVDSNFTSPKRQRFSLCSREQAQRPLVSSAHLRHTNLGKEGPDPGQYTLPAACGRQASSLRLSSPAFSLPRTDRLKEDYERLSKTLPPPGSYETWASIGKQTSSKFRTLPAYGFGSSTWAKEQNRFLSPGHISQGQYSPANYNHQTDAVLTSFGRQSLSSRESPAGVGFGIGRVSLKTLDTPGPGHYD